MEHKNKNNSMSYLDINDDEKTAYINFMAQYHWRIGLPFVYTNSSGELVAQWVDGTIDNLEDEVNN